MKTYQNFYAYLEYLGMSQKNIERELLKASETFCYMINVTKENMKEKEFEEFNNFIDDESDDFVCKFDEAEAQEEKQYIEDLSEQIEQINKFVKFLNAEKKEYEKIIFSKEYAEWINDYLNAIDNNIIKKDLFEDIEFIPAYLDKNCKIKVIDFVETLKCVLGILVSEIENYIGYENFPKDASMNDGFPLVVLLTQIVSENKIKIPKEDLVYYGSLVSAYEDINCLVNIIKYQIEKISE